MKAGIAVGVVTAIVALVVCLVPLKEVAYTVIVDYQDVETYYEDEPYEVIETYYEYEPYQVTETYYETGPIEQPSTVDIPDLQDTTQDIFETFREANRLRAKSYEVLEAKSRYETAYVTLRNTDKSAATFTVSFSFLVTGLDRDWNDGHLYTTTDSSQAEREIYLGPGEEGTVSASAKYFGATSSMTWSYTVWPGIEFPAQSTPSGGGLAEVREGISELLERYRASKGSIENVEKQRTVTKYRQVEKQRTVTKYRQVKKERTIIKQRPETRYKKVTLLDYLLHY